MSRPSAGIVSLAAATTPACGGKARGLAQLIELGLSVPAGFVIVGAERGVDRDALAAAYAQLGAGAVAVRSSAAGEDSASNSYAGQLETVLEVEGVDALVEAVDRCVASADLARVRAYEGATAVDRDADPTMAVIVQRMVAPRCAGVLFTLDPLTGDASRWSIEAVAGLGHALVSGHARPDRYLLDPETGEGPREPAGARALLDDADLAALLASAKRARDALGIELDLEWAIAEHGALSWLQARPITSAGALALDSLDTPLASPSPGFTRYNAGEILPGAITPLSATTTVALLDASFRRLYTRLGVFGPPGSADAADATLVVVSGHLFINLRGLYLFGAKVAGGSKADVDRSLAGRELDELDGYPPRGALLRARMGARAVAIFRRAPHELAAIEGGFAARVRPPSWLRERSVVELLERIEALLEWGSEVAEAHLVASSYSGLSAGVLEGILGRGRPLGPEQRGALTALLRGVGEVESADIGVALRELAEVIAAEPDARRRLLNDDLDAVLTWLRGDASGRAGRRFAAFVDRHGHRAMRELELRELDWSEDPRPLLASCRAILDHRAPVERPSAPAIDELPVSPRMRRTLRLLLPTVHRGIRLRERGKSLVVRAARLLKPTILALARKLVDAGRLPEIDLIYFLARAELPALAHAGDDERRELVRAAGLRRRALARQAALRFAMVSRERPRPLPPAPPPVGAPNLRGTPVSSGVVEGPARVICRLEDAADLAPGEILIVPYTDAGWTPLFCVAAGLATEIGGTLSHGAVVARELGLPAVVDLPDATRLFTTGQRVRLDGDTGRVEALE